MTKPIFLLVLSGCFYVVAYCKVDDTDAFQESSYFRISTYLFQSVYYSVMNYFDVGGNLVRILKDVISDSMENLRNLLHDSTYEYDDTLIDKSVEEEGTFSSLMSSDIEKLDASKLNDALNVILGIDDTDDVRHESDFEYHPMYRLEPGTVGQINAVELPDGRTTTIKTLATQPPLFEIDNFLTNDECGRLMEAANKQGLVRGDVFLDLKSAEQNNPFSVHRKSLSAKLRPPAINQEFLRQIHNRISSVTRVPVYAIEGSDRLRIGQYDKGGFYNAHLDSNGENIKRKPCCFQRACIGSDGEKYEGSDCCSLCRYITFMYYLNDVPVGGETAFPFADLSLTEMFKKKKERPDWYNLTTNCHSSSVVVKPSKGKAIFWYNHFLDNRGYLGGADWRSHHGGCNVGEGTKWVAINLISTPIYAHRFMPSRHQNITESYKKYVNSVRK